MFCSECGESEQDGNYCRKCGTKLRQVSKSSISSSSSRDISLQSTPNANTLHKPFVPNNLASQARMGFGEAVRTCFQKYAVFRGRATRSEYWFWQLFWLVVFVGCVFLSTISNSSFGGTLFGLFILGAFIPSLSVLVRRLHDTGKSGWWVLLNAIPFIGPLVVLVFTLQYSEESENEHGAVRN